MSKNSLKFQSIEELIARSDFKLDKYDNTRIVSLLDTTKRHILTCITSTKDMEAEFIFSCRYLNIIKQAGQKLNNFKKKNFPNQFDYASKLISRLEILQGKLNKLYLEQKKANERNALTNNANELSSKENKSTTKIKQEKNKSETSNINLTLSSSQMVHKCS